MSRGSSIPSNKRQFAEKLEMPLRDAWQLLQEVDGDLAEFAANLFEQALWIVDCAATVGVINASPVTNIAMGNISSSETFDDKSACQQGSTTEELHIFTLQEKLYLLHEHVLCLIDCTEVVDDHHSMLCAGKQTRHDPKASRCALKHLQRVDNEIGGLIDDLLNSTKDPKQFLVSCISA